MIILTGKNLGERQHQLNEKVNEAAKDKINFDTVKQGTENSDVDKFFKIDLAAKYKDVEYILEILKCGDSLYICRALNKCDWLYDDDFKHIINSDFLSTDILPSMSIKMKNLVLATVAINLKNDETRAIAFYIYCTKNLMYNIALKFLIHTSISFKQDIIRKKAKAFTLVIEKEGNYLEHFIGNSFELAELYVKNITYRAQKSTAIYLMRYMYSLSNEKYLNMLETCDISAYTLGRRLSKHIIQNHKSRVMKKPLLYGTVLHKDVISRNVKIEEAKIFAVALLPDRSTRFFSDNYYKKNKFVLDLLPADEKFPFIKKMFNEKYNDVKFETSFDFYNYDFFETMTMHDKESWALQNIASQNEILGSGNDYLWYKFINFDKTFTELRKQIMKTTDNVKRCEMLKVLIDSSKSEEDLTRLLNYYCERHRNEESDITERFLDKLIEDHKVWRFGENCWMALEKIFYMIDVFNKSKHLEHDSDYSVLALLYYILNEKSVPDILHEYLDMNVICFYTLQKIIKLHKLQSETDKILQYILQHYTKKIETLSTMSFESDAKKSIYNYIHYSLLLLKTFDKTKNDLPLIMLTYVQQDWSEFKNEQLLAINDKLSSSDIVHYLKNDAALVVRHFLEIKVYCESTGGNLNWLVQKLKIYFSNDISQKYLVFFNDCLTADTLHYRMVEVAVRGIFVLADWGHKLFFLEKYIPKEKTIDKAKTSSNTLDIQRAICRQMHCSRPPLPVSKVFQYMIGDYVQYCLVLFRSFLLNLPYLQCIEFVKKMIDSPVSIQKHGLRLAFECFDTDKLRSIILDSWKRTKNVSLRIVIYEQLCIKISNENNDTQFKLFDVLITLTLDLNEDDQEALQVLHKIVLPDHLVGRYLEAVWSTVSKFSEKPLNFDLMSKVIKKIENKLVFVPEKCVDKIINDHVHIMLNEREILNNKSQQGFDALMNSKWNLTKKSLVYMINEKKREKNMMLTKHIVKYCIDMWDEVDKSNNKFVIRNFFNDFIMGLASEPLDEKCYSNFVILIQAIEQDIKNALPEKYIYKIVWMLQSSVVAKSVFLEANFDTKVAKDEDIIKFEKSLGKAFGALIQTKIADGSFLLMFYEQIMEIIDSAALHNVYNHFEQNSFSSSDVQIILCSGLLEHEIFETYMLALKILPIEYKGKFVEDYVRTITKIQAFPNKELQFYLYEKFVNTDFMNRNYVTF